MGAASGGGQGQGQGQNQGIIAQAVDQAQVASNIPQYGLGATGYTPPESAGPKPPSLTSTLFRRSTAPVYTAPRYGNQGQFSGTDVTNMVKQGMGNYNAMSNQFQQAGVSPYQISQAAGIQPSQTYTYMNRPDYKQYGPNGQFYQPIYQSQYTDYRNPYVGSGGFGGIMGNLGSYGTMGGMGNQGYGYMPQQSSYGQGGIFGGSNYAPGFSGGSPGLQYAEGGDVAADDGIAALLAK